MDVTQIILGGLVAAGGLISTVVGQSMIKDGLTSKSDN